MRKLIASINITLDGFMAGPDGNLDWHINYWDGEATDSLCRLLDEADTLLLGSNTYKAFADYWPNRTSDFTMSGEDIVITQLMNRLTKVVVSKTMGTANWSNSLVLTGDLKSSITSLKGQSAKNMIVLGSRQLLRCLIKLNLIDRYELWVHPVAIGRGKRLFELNKTIPFQLTDQKVFESGIIRLTYDY